MGLKEKIWNLRLEKKDGSSIKIKAAKGLAGFLAVMLAFTVLSRAADAMTIAQVSTETADKRSIEHKVKAEGIVQAGKEQAVSALGGIKINEVHAEKGQHVEAGAALLTLDLEHLEEEIRKMEIEIEKLDLQISEKQQNQSIQNNKKATDAARAQEDYNLTANSEQVKIDNAYREMVDAYNIWMNAQNAPPAEEGDDPVDVEALREAYEQKNGAYNEIVAARDQALIEKERAIADANAQTEKDTTQESVQLDKEALNLKLKGYYDLREQGGVITAPVQGAVTFVDDSAVTGGMTPETSIMRIADTQQGYKFTTQISKGDKKYLSVGDEVTLNGNDNLEVTGATVESITKNSEDEEQMDVTVNIGANEEVQLFDALTMNVSNVAGPYNTTISIDALHKGSNGEPDYVLVAVEKDSVMGTQLVAEKQTVSVQASNDKFAAITDGELAREQKIIASADKEVQAGDRIRLADQNE